MHCLLRFSGINKKDQKPSAFPPRKTPALVLKHIFSAVIAALVLTAIGGNRLFAQWATDPMVNNPISVASNDQQNPQSISDGSGGAIITWEDFRSGTGFDIYAQRIDASGNVLWTLDGVAISTAANDQTLPAIASDGSGGAIITWQDFRSGTNLDIYAQRINSSGAVQWAPNGEVISTAINNQQAPSIIADVVGGAIITWEDTRGGNQDIYAQRINASGVVAWTVNGVAICTASNTQAGPRITTDGGGGAIMTWQDNRGASKDIYSQRIDASGLVQWIANGVVICTAVNDQQGQRITDDGLGGAIITWHDLRGADQDIYAQRVNSAGSVQWAPNGEAISTASNTQQNPTITGDGAAGAIIAWEDFRTGTSFDIYAQRINSIGAVQWTSNGEAIGLVGSNVTPVIARDGAGGAIIAWQHFGSNIFAQRINSAGTVQWTANGVGVATGPGGMITPAITIDGLDRAIISWVDSRNGFRDIFAQLITAAGNVGVDPPPAGNAIDLSFSKYFYASGSASLTATTELTMEAWVNLRDASVNQKIAGFTNIGNGYLMGVANNQLYPEVWDNIGTDYVQQAGYIPSNVWTHLAIAWTTGGSYIGYINGVEVFNVAASANPIGAPFSAFTIGIAPWDQFSYAVDGQIDELRVWTVARTQAEIQAAMLSPLTGGEPSLAAVWHFDESDPATSSADGSPNGNTAFLVGGGTTFVPSGAMVLPPPSLTVWSTAEAGPGTLRDAIDSANGRIGADTIRFAPGMIGSTIYLNSSLPDLTDDGTVIEGDIDADLFPDIYLNGNFNDFITGITIQSSNNVIKGLRFLGFGSETAGGGVLITGSSAHDNVIIGNYIGVDASNLDYGVLIDNGAYHNFIGDGTAAGKNLIYNTANGIDINTSDNNVIIGNDILNNGNAGIRLQNSSNNTIGGGFTSANQINCPFATGIHIRSGSNGNVVAGNTLQNNNYGIYIEDSFDNQIGQPGVGNTVINNATDGISISAINGDARRNKVTNNQILGNLVSGVQITGQGGFKASQDSILNNSIHDNGQSGIRVSITDSNIFYGNSIFKNTTSGISFVAAQGFIGAPVITNILPDTTIQGTSSPNALIQIFADLTDQGQYFLDTTMADGSGIWSKKVSMPVCRNVTALQDSSGNTSTFSSPFSVSVLDPLSVCHPDDDGSLGSLRGAINYANANIGPDTIRFTSGFQINVDSTLPGLVDSFTVIDGDVNGDGIPDVQLIGTFGVDGIVIYSPYNIIRGLVFSEFLFQNPVQGIGITITGNNAHHNTIIGNYIGTDLTGTGRNGSIGILINQGAHANLIGDGTGFGRNLISGNQNSGISISDAGTDSNKIWGNYIGTDASGLNAVFNGEGVFIVFGPQFTEVGNGTIAGRNIISGNYNNTSGVHIEEASYNFVRGNFIGLNKDGQALPNQNGVFLGSGARHNQIGGNVPGDGNVISANAFGGVTVSSVGTPADSNWIAGNLIGTDTTGTIAIPNGGSGIDVSAGDGGTATGNVIGDTTIGGRNIISGNTGIGISINDAVFTTQVIGNFIGTNVTGTAGLANGQSGVQITGASGNVIGGTTASARNVISGNTGYGIGLDRADGNTIVGNYIGVNLTGNAAFANNDGIFIVEASSNLIGDGTPQGRNVISGNTFTGIAIRANNPFSASNQNKIIGNFIGTQADGFSPLANQVGIYAENNDPLSAVTMDSILFNVIAFNNAQGIDFDHDINLKQNILFGNSIYNNSSGISYFNGVQESVLAPVITFVFPDSTVEGTSSPNALIQIFADSNTQGRIFLDSTIANGVGIWSKKVTLFPGMNLTAMQEENQNTSEFSAPVPAAVTNPLLVNNTNNTGLGSLRDAINYANSNIGPDSIRFDLGLIGATIDLQSTLPTLTDNGTVIEGDIDQDGLADIEINGVTYVVPTGVEIVSDYNEIRFLNVVGFGTNPSGIDINGGAYNVIVGCKMNFNSNGVHILNGAHHNRIGNGSIAGRNFIYNSGAGSSEGRGVVIEGLGTDSNIVAGNFIGTEDGVTPNGNQTDGVLIRGGAKYNRIGDGTFAGRNIISANFEQGVNIIDGGTDSNIVIGNYIGTDSTGNVGLGNQQNGIQVGFFGNYNRIGDGTVGGRNIVSGNSFAGIGVNSGDNTIILGNYVGVGADGATVIPNSAGIFITVGKYTKVGNGTTDGRNVVAGNNFDGIVVQAGSDSTEVLGNYVGLDATGTIPLPNPFGIVIRNSTIGVRVGDGTPGGRNVISGNTGDGLIIQDAGTQFNSVSGNYIGTDVTGFNAIPNGDHGVSIVNGAKFNLIGSSFGAVGSSNVISGNTTSGVFTNGGDSNMIARNILGLTADGASALANQENIFLDNSHQDTILYNVISASLNDGINITPTSSNMVILGNLIGTDYTGTVAIGNANSGVVIQFGSFGNQIGDGTPAGRNIVSGNSSYEISNSGDFNAVRGNYVGTDVSGTADLSTAIVGVSHQSGSNNVVGGPNAGDRNVISSTGYGISYSGGSDNKARNNTIGLNVTLTAPLGGAIAFYLNSGARRDSLIENVIGYSNSVGIYVQAGDSNIFARNSIYNSSSQPIQIDPGAQANVVPPTITTIDPDSTVHGTSSPFALVQVYLDSTDEGQYYTDSTRASGSGNWAKKINLLTGLNLTALQDSAGNTSAFSAPFAAVVSDPLMVINTNDAGPGSLRNAINFANSNAGPDTVRFDISLVGQTINITSGALVVTSDSTFIDGDIDADNAPSITLRGDRIGSGIFISGAHNTVKQINFQQFNIAIQVGNATAHHNTLVGNYVGTNLLGNDTTNATNNNGIYVHAGAYANTIGDSTAGSGNIVVGNTYDGIIFTTGAHDNIVMNNLVGLSIDGSTRLGNTNSGILINSGSTRNLVGSGTPAGRNIISANGTGISTVGADSNTILGNYIGSDKNGNFAVANAYGIVIVNSNRNIIGANNAGNLISGNTFYGIWVNASTGDARDNLISNNIIGTAKDFVTPMGNGILGIRIYANSGNASNDSVIFNTLSYNGSFGVEIEGNGPKADSNIVFGNSIHHNTSGGISLVATAQGFVGTPSIVSIDPDSTVHGKASPNARVHVYADTTNQGQVLAGVTNADGLGNWFVKVPLFAGMNLTALQDSAQNTSAFSAPLAAVVINPLLVTNTNDAGPGSLRNVVAFAESNSGPDTVLFDPSLSGQSISLLSHINLFSDSTVIDGDIDGDFIPSITLQNGGGAFWSFALAGNHNVLQYTNLQGFAVAGVIVNGTRFSKVRGNTIGTNLDGTAAGVANTYGIQIASNAMYNTIGDTIASGRNVISGNAQYGIVFQNNSDSNQIVGNYIGVDATGTAAIANGSGILLDSGPEENFIGNGRPNGRNIISGNSQYGIYVFSSDSNKILGNYIGTNALGNAAIPNTDNGILLTDASFNVIGDTTAGGRNVISGNASSGIVITNGSAVGIADRNKIEGNYIGVQADGISQLGNAGFGVRLAEDDYTSVSNDTIRYNTIAFNGLDGIAINEFGARADSNIIHHNSIHHNTGLGINLQTPNVQQSVGVPFITSIDPDSTVHGKSSPFALIQIYADTTDEGQFFLDTATADGSGNWFKKVTLFAGVNLTALQDSSQNTSAFSAPFAAVAIDPLVVTNTLDDSTIGTLRRAIGFANSLTGRNLITFSLPVNDTILVTRPLPNITDTLDIDGQATNVTISAIPGYTGFAMFSLRAPFSQLRNFNIFGRGIAQRGIFIDNAGAGGNDSKIDNVDFIDFTLVGIQGDAVRDTVINSHIAGNGLAGINAGALWVIRLNMIGTDALGSAAYGIAQGTGVYINVYGGIIVNQNVISGHSAADGAGVRIVESNYNTVTSNGIGVDFSASAVIPNYNGVTIDSLSRYNTIGAPGQGNVISGNANAGIWIQNNGADSNNILGNKIGTDLSGTLGLGNQIGVGTNLTTGPNFIGDGTPAGRNIISASSAHGLYLFGPDVANGNFIGTDVTGTADLGNAAFGVYVYGSNTKILNNVISGNDNAGVYIAGTDNHVVSGNFIGTDSTGIVALPNLAGITLTNVAYGSMIGGTTIVDRNVISGNTTSGLRIENGARNITVLGNFVGLSADGQSDLGNIGNGIEIDDASGNTIGNGTLNGRNFISGNDNWGVDIQFLADSNTVMGNVIGTDSTGTTGVGYSIVGVNVSGPHNQIGGYQVGQGNVIAGGIGYTVALNNSTDNLVAGNFMGVDALGNPITGTLSGFYITGNSRRDSLVGNTMAYMNSSPLVIQDAPTDSITFYGNEIHHNAGDFFINAGAQFGVQPPRITLVMPDSTVMGNAAPNALIQIFADSTNDGQFFLDTTLADAGGLWSKKVPLFAGMAFTAMQDSLGNTSNFSAPFIPSFAPSAPTGLFAIARNGQVELKWNANNDGLTTKYQIYYDITSLPTTLQDSTTGGATDTSKTISGLTNGQIYYFRVAAVNAIEQESGFSNEDAAVPVVEAGNALSFNGVDGYIEMNDFNLGMSDFTLEAWVNPASINAAYFITNRTNEFAGPGNWFNLLMDPSGFVTLELGLAQATAGFAATSTTALVPGKWYHVAATRSGNIIKLYVNGTEEASIADSLVRQLTSGNNIGRLGGWPTANVAWYNGLMDEVRIWHTARTASEINSAMVRPLRGDEPGLVAMYHLDEPVSNLNAGDATSYSNNGSLQNGVAFVTNSGAMAPVGPSGLFAIARNGQVELKWNKNTEEDFFRYHVYGDVTPNPTALLATTADGDANDTTYTATGLVNGQIYYFRVAGEDSAGQIGAYSNEDAAVPVVEAGNALSLNGSTQYAEFPTTLLGVGNATMEAWVNWSGPTGSNQVIFYNGHTSLNGFGLILDNVAGDQLSILSGSVSINNTGIVLPVNTWQHLALVINGGNYEVYRNGQLSFTIAASYVVPSGKTVLGANQGATEVFNGATDEFRVWNSARSQAQISTAMVRPARGDESNLIGAWHLDEPAGITAFDATPLSNNLNVAGGAPFISSGAMAPLKPTGFTLANFAPDSVKVTWAANTETDLSHYIVYRDTISGFIPSPLDSIGRVNVPGTTFTDLTAIAGKKNYYRLAAVDSALQIGPATAEDSVLFVAPVLLALPVSQNFGNVSVGDSSSESIIKVFTNGRTVITSGFSTATSSFKIDSTVGNTTLNSGDTALVYVKYHANAFALENDTLAITNNSTVPTLKVPLSGTGLAGTLATLPAAQNFGSVGVGDSTVQQIVKVFSNGGGVTITGYSTGTASFDIDSTVGNTTLLTGDTVKVYMKYHANVFAPENDTLSVTNNSATPTLKVPLSGTGTAGTLATLPATQNFGSVGVGDSTSQQIIKVFSNGGGVTITGYSVATSSFDIDSTVGIATLLFGDTARVYLKYHANAFGAETDTLQIANNSATPVLKVALDGTGSAGSLATVPASVNFGGIAIDDSSGQQVIKVFSNGGAVTITGYSTATASFDIDSTVGNATLLFGDTALVYLKYHANAFGAETDTLQITNNSVTPILKIALDGTGLAGILASSDPSIDFGNVVVGDSASQVVQVFVPNGSVIVNSSSVSFGTHFLVNVAATLPDTLGLGDTLTFNVKFKPLIVQTLSDTILIANNSLVNPLQIILTGTSVVPAVAPVTIFVYPEADARVSAVNPTTNYGSDPRIYVYGSNLIFQNNESHGYLRFDLSPIPTGADVTATTFQISNSDGFAFNYDPNDYLHFVANDIWNEGTITWNTRPAITSPPVGSWFAWMSGFYDHTFSTTTNALRDSVQNQRMADGKISFNINNATGAYYNNYYSREGAPDNARRPQLIITYLPPTLATLAPSVNFGSVQIGDSLTQTLKIFSAAGDVSVTSSSLQLGGDYSMIVAGGLPRTLTATPGDTLFVDVKFKPTSFGTHVDTVNANNNSAVDPFRIDLTGTGGVGTLASNFSNINYGNVFVGDSSQQVVKIYTTAGSVQWTGSSLQFGGAFRLDSTVGLTILNTGDTLRAYVTYKPSAFISQSDTLLLTNNSSVTPFKVSYDATGTSPVLSSAPASVNYGSVFVGDSLQQTVKVFVNGGLVNIGSVNLFAGTTFKIDSTNAKTSLTTIDTLRLYVKFIANNFGAFSDTIVIANSSAVSPFKVAMTASGVPGNLAASVASLSFGNVQNGDSAQAFVKIFSNLGSVQTAGSSLFAGADFAIDSTVGPSLLAAGDTQRVYLKFRATSFGLKQDTLQIANNSGVNPFKVSMSGTGTAGFILASGNNFTFGATQVGDSSQQSFKLYGTANGMVVNSGAFDFGNDFVFVPSLALPAALNVGDTLTVQLRFKPGVFGSLNDTLRFNNNSAVNPLNVVMNGTGGVGTLAAVPGLVNFGVVPLGDSTLRVMNLFASVGAVRVDSLRFDFGTEFSLSAVGALPDTLFPGDTLPVTLKFKPTVFATRSDTIGNFNNSTLLRITLNGIGNTGTLTSVPGNLDFGNVLVGDSAQQQIKVYATVSSVLMTTAGLDFGTDFTITSTSGLPHTLTTTPGDTLLINIKFKPSAFGSYSDKVNLANNSIVNPFKVNLSGTGVAGGLASLPAAHNFGNVLVTDSVQQQFKIFASAGQAIVNTFALDSSIHFTLSSAATLPDTLRPGDTLLVNVKFKPVSFGALSDTIRFLGTNSLLVDVGGTGQSGALTSDIATANFGSARVGDSVFVLAKMYVTTGRVIVNNFAFGLSGQFGVANATALPVTLNIGDTLQFNMRFRPNSTGVKLDTLYVGNNSAVTPYIVAVNGTGFTNTAPNAFTVKLPGLNGTTNSKTPNLSWQGTGDIDGDTLSYQLEISLTTDFTTPILSAAVPDTFYAVAVPLDSIGSYYWRVTADDGKGGTTVSDTGYFHVDAVVPNLYVGVLGSSVLKNYLAVFTHTDKLLDSLTGTFILRDASLTVIDSVTQTQAIVAGQSDLYYSTYRLSTTGQLTILMTGVDSAGNVAVSNRTFDVAALSKNAALTAVSNDHTITLTAPKGTVDENGYVLFGRVNGNKQAPELLMKMMRKVMGENYSTARLDLTNGSMTQIGAAIEIISTTALKKELTLKISYDDRTLAQLRRQYPDFDEKKIGAYLEENGQWVFAGGEGSNQTVSMQMRQTGMIALFYNENHVSLPKSVELAQNYPNPFNPATTIRFTLARREQVVLKILDALGREVATLINGAVDSGEHAVVFEASKLASGTYYYHLKTATSNVSKAMQLLK